MTDIVDQIYDKLNVALHLLVLFLCFRGVYVLYLYFSSHNINHFSIVRSTLISAQH